MNVREIVEQYLKENGYDGLYYSDVSCGCRIGDLQPCDGPCQDCIAGYKRSVPMDHNADYWIGPKTEAQGGTLARRSNG